MRELTYTSITNKVNIGIYSLDINWFEIGVKENFLNVMYYKVIIND